MKTTGSLLAALFLFISSCTQESNTSVLETGFKNPPSEAKARTWWHWISGNVSKSGITKDLEAMKEVGIQEAQLFNVHLGFPQSSLEYLSDAWLDLFYFAAQEAKRLDLELAFHNSAGWSSSGGPWVKPEHAMQTVVFSEVTVSGNQTYKNQLPQPETKLSYYQDIAVLAFPKPKEIIKIDNLDYKNLSGRIRNHLLPDEKQILKEAVINKEEIINLTSKLSKDGVLEWNVPKGDWVILRLGHTPVGKKNHPATKGGGGLEVDKMSKTAVDAYWMGGIQPIINKLGDLVGSTVTNCLIDSYEVGTQNWTTGFETQFETLRGYDLKSYLPILAGYYIDTGEISERFLWDFRRTIGDLMAENYYAHFGELCHKNGLKFSVEPYWGPFDNMQVGATGDIVMCEFWSGGYPFFDSPKFVSSIAHLNGSSIIGAESFTGIGGWNEHPAQLKSIGDRAWAEGITRFIFHTYVHQPWDVAPGLALSYHGTDFNRLNTWWSQSKAFMDYIARSQFLLQQGKNVADVLVFTGESSPNDAFLFPEIKKLGFDYDLIGANKLNELTVKNGIIYSSVSNPYKVLVLPNSDFIKPETLQKIKQLVDAGAKVIGNKPLKSPSLSGYPNCDDVVKNLTNQLWASGLVKDMTIEDFLSNPENIPDFKIKSDDASDMSFIHRKFDDAEIYFIANARKESREITVDFRVDGKQPELWNAETGKIENVVVFKQNSDGTTSIPIQLGIEEAVFVIFKKPVNTSHLVDVKMQLVQPKATSLSNLKIIKAEYGTFLQEGLLDITDLVKQELKENEVNFSASRQFCDCDPAMGYVKEFRMEYKIGNETKFITAAEKEQVSINGGREALVITRALFGKFKAETKGVPKFYPYYDITDEIKNLVNSGIYDIRATDSLINNKEIEGFNTSLKITFSTDGETQTVIIPKGQMLKLSKDITKPSLVAANGKTRWVTPNIGEITYTDSSGKTSTAEVKSVPEPIVLNGTWDVSFPIKSVAPQTVTFNELKSWSAFTDENIKYFSGTASYKKDFILNDDVVKADKSLELDLGSVAVIAEVFINGESAGVLWKAPYRINIDAFVKKGKNSLEVKITNLWSNRLIGDENLPLDIERKGDKTKKIPSWLLNNTKRSSKRTTFPSWNHYKKEDALKTSGLLGPVKIIVLAIKEI